MDTEIAGNVEMIHAIDISSGMLKIAREKEKPFLNSLLSLGRKIGILPEMVSFINSELQNLFNSEKFKIVETYCLKPDSPQYSLIAMKQKIE